MIEDDAAMPVVGIRPRAHLAEQMVADGLVRHDREQFVLAALQYQSILADPSFAVDDPYRADIQSGLGATLCLLAQDEGPGAKSLEHLARAEVLLGRALEQVSKQDAPIAWATTRANLAIVLLTRHEQTRVGADLLTALMAMDGVAQVFARDGDQEAEAWARAITARLDALKRR